MVQRRRDGLAGGGLPDASDSVAARRENHPAVWTESTLQYVSAMVHRRREAPSCGGVPDSRGLVFASRGHVAPVRAEPAAKYAVDMRHWPAQDLPGGNIPDSGRAAILTGIGGGRDDAPSIGTEIDIENTAFMFESRT